MASTNTSHTTTNDARGGAAVREHPTTLSVSDAKERYPVTSRPGLYACIECGCIDVQGTAWVELNKNEMLPDEPPNDDIWCPNCEEHYSRVRIVGDLMDDDEEPAPFTLVAPQEAHTVITVSVPEQVSEALGHREPAIRLYVACRAVEARIRGEFDRPELAAEGPLSTKTTDDVLRIIAEALEQILA